MGSVGLHQAKERRQGSFLPFKSIAQSTSLKAQVDHKRIHLTMHSSSRPAILRLKLP
jgi:hypothetical protein